MRRALAALLSAVLAVSMLSAAPEAAAQAASKVLVFHATSGERLDSIEAGIAAIEDLGDANGFDVEETQDPAAFTAQNLEQYRAVVFLSTSGNNLNAAQRDAFQAYVEGGGGFVGIHEAARSEADWSWFTGLIGSRPGTSPTQVQGAIVERSDPAHPSSRELPLEWERSDVWFNWSPNPTGDVHTVARVRERSYSPGQGSNGWDHPISWCRDYQGGRSFYTGMGNTSDSFADDDFRGHLLGAIQWAAGMVRGNCKAAIDDSYEATRLTQPNAPGQLDQVGELHGISIADDGRVFYIGRGGAPGSVIPQITNWNNPNVGLGAGTVHVWNPATEQVTLAGILDVFGNRGSGGFDRSEEGLVGIVLDPDFLDNGWIYLHYTPHAKIDAAARRAVRQVSRFTLDHATNQLDLDSEEVLLEWEVQIERCCHAGGDMAFDSQGNLYIATGDTTASTNTGGYSANYAPNVGGAVGGGHVDARRTSGNTNNLNGKILRITPQPDGSYTIPEGNLFTGEEEGGGLTRPEIYVMGTRNPSRFWVDPVTDWVYSGVVGPDAGNPSTTWGPAKYEWFTVHTRAGNQGWPFCKGDKQPFRDRANDGSTPLGWYDCDNLVNDSPHNTGLREIPPMDPHNIWYSPQGGGPVFNRDANGIPIYNTANQTITMPYLFSGGAQAAMGGPVYRHDPDNDSDTAWPAYWDEKWLIGDFYSNRVRNAVVMDPETIADGGAPTHAEEMRGKIPTGGSNINHIHGWRFGPDGALYVLDYGAGAWFGIASGTALWRVDYTGGPSTPAPAASADPEQGAAPLEVAFSSGQSGGVSVEWDFGDGSPVSTEANPTHTYTTEGQYTATLTVTYADGEEASVDVAVTVGTPPEVDIEQPAEGGLFDWGDDLPYDVSVEADEDVDCDRVEVDFSVGDETVDATTGCEGTVNTGDPDRVAPDGTVTASYTTQGDAGGNGGGDDEPQVLTWTGDNNIDAYASAPATATAGPATLVFENNQSTGNTIFMPHTLTFTTDDPEYNDDVDVDIFASPADEQGGRHEVEVTLTEGVYHYYCAVQGHLGAGMEGVLVVTAADDDDPDEPGPGLTGSDEVRVASKHQQAEDADARPGTTLTSHAGAEGGLRVTNIDDGDWLRYDDVNLENIDTVIYRATSPGFGGIIELRSGAPDGELISTASVGSTEDGDTYGIVSAAVDDPGGLNDLYVVFRAHDDNPGGSDLFDLDAIYFYGDGVAHPESQFEPLFDGSQESFDAWQHAGGGQFVLNEDGTMSSTGSGGLGLLWYPEREFDDFSLKLQWRDDRTDAGHANSGVFVRFPAEGNIVNTSINQGHEIQIYDGPTGEPQKSGSIYNAAPLTLAQANPVPKGEWTEYEIRVVNQVYTVIRDGQVINRFTNTSPARGLSGHIGLQWHDANSLISFRDVRIKELRGPEGVVMGDARSPVPPPPPREPHPDSILTTIGITRHENAPNAEIRLVTSWPAELLPDAYSVTVPPLFDEDEPPIRMPDTSGEFANVATSQGQTYTLPRPEQTGYDAVHVFGATSDGQLNGTFTLHYTDGSTQQVTRHFADWAVVTQVQSPTRDAFGPLAYRHRADGSGNVDGYRETLPGGLFLRIYHSPLPADPERTLEAVTLPQQPASGNARIQVLGLTFEADGEYYAADLYHVPDDTPPEVSAAVSGGVGTATVTVFAEDDLSGIRSVEYAVGDGDWTEITDGYVYFDEPGDYTVHYRATDNDLNVSEEGTVEFTVEEARELEPFQPLPVTIDAPSSAAGEYGSSAPAGFGPAPPVAGIAGDVVLVNDGSANPTLGCDPLIDFPEGAIALIDRGTCPFVQKVLNAQAAGAVAVLIANNTGGAPTVPGGSSDEIDIPTVMISQADGNTIKQGLPATGMLRTVAPDEGSILNATGITNFDNRFNGDVETSGTSWIASSFPDWHTVTMGDFGDEDHQPWRMPDTSGAYPNIARALGQTYVLPEDAQQRYHTLHVLNGASNGPRDGVFTLNYTDGSSDDVDFTSHDWANNSQLAPPSFEVWGPLGPQRHTGSGSGVQTLPSGLQMRAYSTPVEVDPSKTLESIQLPPKPGSWSANQNILVLGMTLEADGAFYPIDTYHVAEPDEPEPQIPAVTATLEPAEADGEGGWWVSPVTVTLAADQSDAVIEYRVGDGDWVGYSAPFVVDADGQHTVEYRASNAAGESPVGSVEVWVDLNAPSTEVALSGELDGDVYTTPVTVTLSADDGDGSGVAQTHYRMAGDTDHTVYDGSFVVEDDGEHTVEFRSVDVAGNVEDWQSVSFEIDTQPAPVLPTVEAAFAPADPDGQNGWWVSPVTMTLTADDTDAVIEYRVGDGDWVAYTGAVVFDDDGEHTVGWRATNAAGTTDEATRNLRIDLNAPTVEATLAGDQDGDVYTGPVTVSLAADDGDGSGVAERHWRMAGDDDHTVYDGSFVIEDDGEHTVEFRATDVAGNVSEWESVTFTIEIEDVVEPPACDGMVMFGSLDSGVADRDSGNGDCVSDLVNADGVWRTKGVFVSHVTQVANSLRQAGVIDNRERSALTSAAARSGIGGR